ncbi:MAG: type VI secretion system baseplate subunit TssK [Phycisphaerae bacterium]
MSLWPELHWFEGQFLRPHHLQAMARNAETLRAAALSAALPHPWGFATLDLAEDAISNHIAEIRSCELILRDGTYVRVPENCLVEAREFKKTMDKSTGPVEIFFGVPQLQIVRPNVQNIGEELNGRSPRFAVDLVERYDENSGDNPQTIEVRRMRGAIFFGDEDRGGYECVRLGKIERSASGPKLMRDGVPPLLRIKAWQTLVSDVENARNDIRARCEQLGADAAQRALTFATATPADSEQLIKLAALNELTVRFGAFVGTPEHHPYALYLLLSDAIGKVALWDDLRRPRDLSQYVHDDCGPVFFELFTYLRTLINGLLPKDYIERPFQEEGGGYKVELDYEWFTPNHELFMGVRTSLSVEQVVALFKSTNFKLASPRQSEEVYKGGLMGLKFDPAGAVANLPKSSDQHYFRIQRSPRYWENCEAERAIYIRMPPADKSKFASTKISLFVVKIR